MVCTAFVCIASVFITGIWTSNAKDIAELVRAIRGR